MATPICSGMRSPTSACATGASASMNEAGQDAGEQAERGEHEHGGEREAVGLRAPSAAAGVRGAAEEGDAERLDEAGGGQRRRQREQRADGRHQELQAPLRQLRAEQDRLEGQPFGDEAVERRQRRDGDAADEEDEGRLRHAVDEAAEMLHVALAGRGQHGAGAEEQQALEQRMIEDVEQRGGEGERRGGRHAVRLEGEREAEADEDDADILDRVIGEQPLQIVLHQRIEHAHHAGDAGERQHDACSTTRPAARADRRRCARSRRPRPWSSRRSSAPRRGSAPPDERAAARHAAARGRPSSRRRSARG